MYGSDAVDAITAIALSLRYIQDNKVDFNGTNLQTVLRNNITFTGLTGKIDFDELGDRSTPIYEMRNFQKYSNTTVNFVLVGLWSTDGFVFTNYTKIVWQDGTTDVPDLDVRDPIKYWSCWDGEEGEDKTG